MTPETARVLDRVRKLLALATSPNVHEAALAASRAQALIDAHRLQGLLDAETEDDAQIQDARETPLASGRRLRKWKVVLAQQLAEMNGCVVYTAKVGREKRLVLVGTELDRAAVQALWDWLCPRIEWLSATHSDGRDKQWHEAFRVGAVQTIAERLRSARVDAVNKLESAAIVVAQTGLARRQDRVDRFVERNLKLKKGRNINVDAAAFARGRQAGADFPLPEER